MFAGSLFLSLALASYRVDPSDPSLSGSNWAGAAGAALAAILVQGFGIVAWLVPLDLAFFAAPLFKGRRAEAVGLRIAGDLLVAIVLSALVQVAAPDAIAFRAAPAAGNVGMLFGELMRELFSTVGSFLVGPTLVALILIGRASFSFIDWSRRTLAWLERLLARAVSGLSRVTCAWREARALRRSAQATSERAPAIEVPDRDQALLMQLGDDIDWIPIDQTGPLPLALSSALRGTAAFEDLEPAAMPLEESVRPVEVNDIVAKGATTPGPPQPEPEAPPRARPKRKPAEASGPEIVDTEPERVVERLKDAGRTRVRDDFRLPGFDLLDANETKTAGVDEAKLRENSALLVKTLLDYGVQARSRRSFPGRP